MMVITHVHIFAERGTKCYVQPHLHQYILHTAEPYLTIVCRHTFYTLRKVVDEDCVKNKQKINTVITKPTYLLSIEM